MEKEFRTYCAGPSDFTSRLEKFTSELMQIGRVASNSHVYEAISYEGRLKDFPESDHWKILKPEFEKTFSTLYEVVTVSSVKPGSGFQIEFGLSSFDGVTIGLRLNGEGFTKEILDSLYTNFTPLTSSEVKAMGRTSDHEHGLNAANLAASRLQELVAALGDLHATTVSNSTKFVEDTTAFLEQKRAENEVRFQAEIAEERGKIQAEKLELDKKEASLNLRESRGVRRKLLEDIKTLAEEQKTFERSAQTRLQSTLITRVSVMLFVAGITLTSLAFFIEDSKPEAVLADSKVTDSNLGWRLAIPTPLNPYVPFASGTLLIASTAIFFLRHLRLIYTRSEDTDFSIMQFHRDVLRMSWVAELVFEAENNRVGDEFKSIQIPPVLLEQFSKSLFTTYRDSGSPHPIDDIQQLAKRFKRVSIGSKGLEVESLPMQGLQDPKTKS